MRCLPVLIVAMLLGVSPPSARAQANESRPFAWDVARAALSDPTTYVPALISYKAMQQDWKTSQVLFMNGWVEQNSRFTVSGRPNDVPVSASEDPDSHPVLGRANRGRVRRHVPQLGRPFTSGRQEPPSRT